MPRYTGVLVACFFVIVCFAITGTMFPAFWRMPDCSDSSPSPTGEEVATIESDPLKPVPGKTVGKEPEPPTAAVPAPTPIQEATMPRSTKLEPLSEIKKSLEPVEPSAVTAAKKEQPVEPNPSEKPGQSKPTDAVPAKETAKEPAKKEQPAVKDSGKADLKQKAKPGVPQEPTKVESLPLPRKAEPLADSLGRNDAPPQNAATPQPRIASQKTPPPPAPSVRETSTVPAAPSRSELQGMSKSTLTAMDKPPTIPKDPDFAAVPKTETPDLPQPASADALPRYAEKKTGVEEPARKTGTQKDAPTTYGTRARAEAIKRQALGADLPPNPTESWWGN